MSGDSFVLADLEVLGDDESLRAQADAARDAVGDGEPSDTYSAEEPTRSIRVTVDHRGLLVDIHIAEWWSDRLPADQFASTLFDVYTAATHKALVVEMSTRDGSPPPRETAPPPELSFEEWFAQITRTLAENDATLLAARRVRPLPADEEVEWRSEHGYVTLHVRGGMAAGLSANAAVLGYAKADVLRGDVLEVFTDAGLTV